MYTSLCVAEPVSESLMQTPETSNEYEGGLRRLCSLDVGQHPKFCAKLNLSAGQLQAGFVVLSATYQIENRKRID